MKTQRQLPDIGDTCQIRSEVQGFFYDLVREFFI